MDKFKDKIMVLQFITFYADLSHYGNIHLCCDNSYFDKNIKKL